MAAHAVATGRGQGLSYRTVHRQTEGVQDVMGKGRVGHVEGAGGAIREQRQCYRETHGTVISEPNTARMWGPLTTVLITVLRGRGKVILDKAVRLPPHRAAGHLQLLHTFHTHSELMVEGSGWSLSLGAGLFCRLSMLPR